MAPATRVESGPGHALRSRLAAQADAAFASAEHPLRQLLNAPESLKASADAASFQIEFTEEIQEKMGDAKNWRALLLEEISKHCLGGDVTKEDLEDGYVSIIGAGERRRRINPFDLKAPAPVEEDFPVHVKVRALPSTAARLLLSRPQREPREAKQVAEEVDMEALRRAAEAGDLKALAQVDKRLKKLLDSDEILKNAHQEGDLADPDAKNALRLYKDSFMSLERGGQDREKQAFQAVTRDDSLELEVLLGCGVSPEVTNKGGQTLLQVASQRGSVSCLQVLREKGATL